MWICLGILIVFLNCFIRAVHLSKPPLSLAVSESVSRILSSSYYADCKLFLIYGNFKQGHSGSLQWSEGIFEEIASSKRIISDSAGITNVVIDKGGPGRNEVSDSNPFLPKLTQRPFRTLSAERYCHVVILVLLGGLHPSGMENIESPEETENILHSKLNLPLLHPLTWRNEDKYLILSGNRGKSSLYESRLIRDLKYKLFLILDEATLQISYHTYCPHCPIKEKVVDLETIKNSQYFPDFQASFHSSTLKVSATDKLPGLLEIETDSTTGINYPKRGVYASALSHLGHGLNFTWKLYRSSGGGSTGHPLPNGTWSGSVGDVVNGKVDFGLVCGMTFIRHPVIELCATITYEYISFAVGPSQKVFTWLAIFWPFDALLWSGMLASSFLVIISAYFILKYSTPTAGEISPWSVWNIAAYLPRTFLEQAEDLPGGLSESIKIILGFWLLFSMIGATLYRAKMVGFMTFPVFSHAPETFDELAKSRYNIQFHYFGNVAYNTFKTSTSPTYMAIFRKMSREPNPLECLKSNLNEGNPTACILFGCVYEELKNRNLSDKFGQSPLKISPNYGFMYTPGVLHEKKASFSSNFKWILQNSMQMGLNQQWERTDLSNLLKLRNLWLSQLAPELRKNASFQYDFETDEDVLHLKHFKGAFTVLLGGLFCALFAFIWEKWGPIWKGKARQVLNLQRKKASSSGQSEIQLLHMSSYSMSRTKNVFMGVLSLSTIIDKKLDNPA